MQRIMMGTPPQARPGWRGGCQAVRWVALAEGLGEYDAEGGVSGKGPNRRRT